MLIQNITFATTRLVLYVWKVMTDNSIHSHSYDCSYNFCILWLTFLCKCYILSWHYCYVCTLSLIFTVFYRFPAIIQTSHMTHCCVMTLTIIYSQREFIRIKQTSYFLSTFLNLFNSFNLITVNYCIALYCVKILYYSCHHGPCP